MRQSLGYSPFAEITRFTRDGPTPLADAVPGNANRRTLHLAFLIPPFGRASGGHGTIFHLVRRLEAMGHTCSLWIYDPRGESRRDGPAVLRRRILDWYGPVAAPVFKGFEDWYGADVAIATAWDSAYQTVLLSGCRARAYLINDHEPEFYATSAEAIWAARSYTLGLSGISASRWLRDLLAERYGQRGTWFQLGVDDSVYRPRPVERRRDTVIVYGRSVTPRRAVPLALSALHEVRMRRPTVRFRVFGQRWRAQVPFPYDHLGVLSPTALSFEYSRATVGVCLSLTNYSLIPQEMMACGLPCVDLAGGSSEAEFGRDGPLELAEADPISLADAIERLLSDDALWHRRSEAGAARGRIASWEFAAQQVEQALRQALREREESLQRSR